MKLKAGKYKGCEVSDVPHAYLGWMLKNVRLDPETERAVATVYYRREWGDPELAPEAILARLRAEARAAVDQLRAGLDELSRARRGT